MNSHRWMVSLCVLSAALLLGAAVAPLLGGQAGGEKGHARTGRPVRRSTASLALTPRGAPSASSSTPRSTPGRARSYPDQAFRTVGAARAVATFVRGFLAWSLGRGAAHAIPNATHGFIAQTRAHPPNIPPAERHERMRVTRIRVLAGHPPVAVVDLAPTAGARFQLDFYLVHRGGRWLVSATAIPG